MKRRAKMNRNKKRQEISKKLSNPVNRFKRLMKNVGKQNRRTGIVP